MKIQSVNGTRYMQLKNPFYNEDKNQIKYFSLPIGHWNQNLLNGEFKKSLHNIHTIFSSKHRFIFHFGYGKRDA